MKNIMSASGRCIVAGVFLLLAVFSVAAEASDTDSFIEGYAAAVIEREFNRQVSSLAVKDGVVTLSGEEIQGVDSASLVSALLGIRGVERVEITGSGRSGADAQYGSGVSPSGGDVSESESWGAASAGTWMGRRLFDPLIADPRWPSFSGAYQFYPDDKDLENVAAASVGDVVPLYTSRVPLSSGGLWQVGAQVGAFVIHDFDTTSWDQVNADYLFGVTMAYRNDDLSGIFRVFHFSSHIGDEYLLHNNVRRENYSYEALGLILSKDMNQWLRLYGGGEFRFSRSPEELEPFVLQYGGEIESPRAFLKDIFRPVAALDVKHREDNNWSGDLSLQAGVKIESDELIDNKFRFMVGYYNGHSPNGQFYQETVDFLSFGLYYNH